MSVIRLVPPSHPLLAEVELPASKSEANRAAVLQALLPGLRVARGPSCNDTAVFDTFLERYAPHSPPDKGVLNLQLAGTAARFLTALACVLPGQVVLAGSPRLSQRPLAPLLLALQTAGASVECLGTPGQLPLRITGQPHWQPGHIRLLNPTSSQMLSALLLLGPHWQPGTTVQVVGGVPSAEYTQLTLQMLANIGVVWQAHPSSGLYTLMPHSLPTLGHGLSVHVEADWSAACYWLAWLRLLGGKLHLPGLRPPIATAGNPATPSLQPDAMAAKCILPNCLPSATALGVQWQLASPQPPEPYRLNCASFPDQAQTFAALAAMATRPSLLTGLHTLPGKETDRLAASAHCLQAAGCAVRWGGNYLYIRPPGTFHAEGGLAIQPEGDHRMAMAFSLLAYRLGKVEVHYPEVVEKSYPQYWEHLRQAGFRVEGY